MEAHWICDCPEGYIYPVSHYVCLGCGKVNPHYPKEAKLKVPPRIKIDHTPKNCIDCGKLIKWHATRCTACSNKENAKLRKIVPHHL